jgi:hypothetical protein
MLEHGPCMHSATPHRNVQYDAMHSHAMRLTEAKHPEGACMWRSRASSYVRLNSTDTIPLPFSSHMLTKNRIACGHCLLCFCHSSCSNPSSDLCAQSWAQQCMHRACQYAVLPMQRCFRKSAAPRSPRSHRAEGRTPSCRPQTVDSRCTVMHAVLHCHASYTPLSCMLQAAWG